MLAAVLLASSGPVGGQDEEFPIGAWFPGGLSNVFNRAHWEARLDTVTAAGFNTIHAAHTSTRRTSTFNQSWMALAHARDLNVQLHSWQQPPDWRTHSRNYWTRTFEAEDGDLFTYPIGRQVTDGDRIARYAATREHNAGLLLDSGSTAHNRLRLRRNGSSGHNSRFGYHVFWLKADDATGTDHIATLRVLHPDPAAPSGWTVMDSTIVRKFHLHPANTYRDIDLEYDIGHQTLTDTRGSLPVRYQVHWTGADTLWVDNIRAHDWEIDPATRRRVIPPNAADLFRGAHDANITTSLAAYYGGTVTPPWRFALYDEPRWELRESVAYVDSLIEAQTGDKGISPYNVANRQAMQRYVDTVSPSEMLVDFYPILHGTPPAGPGPAYANALRGRLDWLATGYGIAREVSQRAEIPLWSVVQVHNWGTLLRTPTREEIRVQVHLALAHGATGIFYFLHHAYRDANQGQVIDGLVDTTGARTPRLDEVESLNAKMDSLAPTYLALASDTVFVGTAPTDFVHGLSATRGSTRDHFLGTFTHTDNSRYLMIVNESTTDTTMVTVTLNAMDLPGSDPPYRFLDVYRNTPISAGGRNPNRPRFSVTLGPGDGTLFRVEKVPVPPPPPNLTATPGNRKLTLSWETPANNGSALRRFQYRRSVDGGRTWAPDWSRDTIIPRSGPTTTSHVLGGLTNGTAYTFEIRARSGAGDGAAAAVTATPLGPPANLRAEAGDGRVTLRWDDPSPKNETIAQWQYRSKRASVTEWGAWQTEEEATARQVTVKSLNHGHEYQFEVRAVNAAAQAGPAASASAVLHEVAFNATGYVLIEGGEPVDGQSGSDRVEVMVLLTPAPPSGAGVAIPLTVGGGTAAAADYEVGPPKVNTSRVLTFGRNEPSKSFTLVVKADADTTHETVLLGFGTPLPAGVRPGERATATVTLYDTPNAPTNVRAEPGHETVTLRWDDPEHGSIRGWQYRKRLGGPGNDWEDWAEAGSGATRTEYTVPNLTNGLKYMFKVRAFNTRGYGAASATVEATPSGLRATAYNGAVGLDWVDPEVAGLASWQRRHRPVLRGGKWSPFARHGGGAGTHVVGNLTNDQKYRFEVQGLNAAGEVLDKETCGWSGGRPCTWQAEATPKATLPDPPPPPCRLSLTGPAAVSYAEHGTGWVAVYTPGRSESCDASLALTWTRRGADAAAFTVSGDTLYFAAEPDYEQPVDAGGDNAYDLQVWIRAGSDSTHAPVQVRVSNIEEPGEVSVSGTLSLSGTTMAAVDSQLTASLSDADGVRPEAIAWEWHRWSLTATPPGWQPLDGEDASTYTPSRSVLGARLRVRATYTDGHGPGKSAEHTSIDRVVDVPDAPGDLSPSAGDGSVTLSWDGAVSNGAAITGYEHRRRPNAQGAAQRWTAWGQVPVEEEDQARDARSLVVSSLSNGTEYSFEVRAVNGVGPGVAADTTATPMACLATVAGPDSVRVRERAPGDSVIAVFTVTGCGGSAVTANRWEITGADVETRRDTLQIDGSGQVSFRHEAPDYEGPTDQDFDRDHEVQVRARVGTAWSAPRALVVTVTNEDDPGTFTFSGPPRPRVGETFGATLADEDGGAGIDDENEAHGWRWEPPSAPLPPPGASGSVSLLRDQYKVPAAAAGRRIRVSVTYDDAHGPDKTARDSTGVVRANVPEPPGDLQAEAGAGQAEAGAGQVELTWTAAADNGAAVDLYEVRYRSGPSWSGRDWWEVPGEGSARDTTVTGLTDTEHVFQVRAHNAEGYGRADSVRATPLACAATVSGPDSVLVRERAPADSVIAAFAVADCHGSAVTASRWQITGADVETRRDTLQIDASGQVSFKHRAPDYETPTDQDRDHDHEVQVRAWVGAAWSAPRALVVSIANRDDPGRVTMTPSPPRVGRTVTAQLVDEDGNTGNTTRTWTWGRVGTAGGQHHIPSVILTTNSYKPKPADAGYRLRATVSYEDAHGPGKTARGQSAQPVRGVAPGPPKNLSAASGDRRVRLTWAAADDSGSAIDRYEVRRGSGSWTAVPGGGSARDTTVTGLTNGTGYTFQVRAHNAEGDGPAAAVTATPATVPGVPPDVEADPGDGQVELSWGEASANGSGIEYYQTQHQLTDGGSWSGWSRVGGADGDGSARSRTITGLMNKKEYTFQVRAKNGRGHGAAGEDQATPVAPNGRPRVSGPETPEVAENGSKKVGTYTGTDPDGDTVT